MEDSSCEEGRRFDRSALLSYEQLATPPSNPAHPISPFAESAPASPPAADIRPRTNAAQSASAVPATAPHDPPPRLPIRVLSNPVVPARSRLTPSQRAELRRPSASRSNGCAYVTYTVDPRT
jgi:hypothetical protein